MEERVALERKRAMEAERKHEEREAALVQINQEIELKRQELDLVRYFDIDDGRNSSVEWVVTGEGEVSYGGTTDCEVTNKLS